MRLFVAGATGVIGRRVVPLLLERGNAVTGIARTNEKRRALERQGAAGEQVSLFDREALRRAVRGHDAVINFATRIPPSSRAILPRAWAENDRIRSEGAANLADAASAAGAELFVQESFAPIYPDRGDEWIDEEVLPTPARYNRSTLAAEVAAAGFTAAGARGIVLRFAFFYGPDSAFTLDMIRSVRRGLAPSFRPESFMSTVSHDDAASAVLAVLDAPSGIYNVVDSEPLRRREIFDSIARLLGVGPPRFLPGWLSKAMGSLGETMSRSQRISSAKLRSTAPWTPRYPSFKEGLADLTSQYATSESG